MKRLWIAACALVMTSAAAQNFPSGPVRIVIGFPPGGGIDSVARLMAPKMSESLKQPVVVENRPGANGRVAMDMVAKAAPDGHTLFMGTSGNLAMNPAFYPDMPFSVEKDFTPVTQAASLPFLLVAHPSVPFRTVAELIAHAKANPGKLNYSSSGNGSTLHLAGELFNSMAGINTVHVPFKGSAPSVSALLGGQVHYTFDAPSTTLPHVRSGKLRALGQTGLKRAASMPDVPAVAETLPGYEVVNWYGVVVPAGTPHDVVTRLNAEMVRALRDPQVAEKITAIGINPVGDTPEEFAAFLKAETEKWTRVIRQAKIEMK